MDYDEKGIRRVAMVDYSKKIDNVDIIDSHAHIGAINSIGFSGENPIGSIVDLSPDACIDKTTLFDLLCAPYLGSLLYSLDLSLPIDIRDITEKDTHKQQMVWDNIKPILKSARGTGVYVALDNAFNKLYNISINEVLTDDHYWKELSRKISHSYENGLHHWCQKALGSINIKKIINPVHLTYINKMSNIEDTDSIFYPILRVDDLLGYSTKDKLLDWSYLNDILNMEIGSVDDLIIMVNDSFDLMHKKGVKAIKQFQAYSRTLEFKDVSYNQAVSSFECLDDGSTEDKIIIQDYIMELILEKASQYNMAYQIHTGMANIPNSNPALLSRCIERYPNVNFVLLHCYPYLREAAFLARTYKNVYLDTAWLALQSPGVIRKAFDEWIGFVPYSKICISCDATNVEESYGSYMITKQVLNQVLIAKTNDGEIDQEFANDMIDAMFYDNAIRLYM